MPLPALDFPPNAFVVLGKLSCFCWEPQAGGGLCHDGTYLAFVT